MFTYACVWVLNTAFSYVKNAFLLLLSRIKDRVGSYFTNRKSWHFRSLIIRLPVFATQFLLFTHTHHHPWIGKTKKKNTNRTNETVYSMQRTKISKKINVWLPLNCTHAQSIIIIHRASLCPDYMSYKSVAMATAAPLSKRNTQIKEISEQIITQTPWNLSISWLQFFLSFCFVLLYSFAVLLLDIVRFSNIKSRTDHMTLKYV